MAMFAIFGYVVNIYPHIISIIRIQIDICCQQLQKQTTDIDTHIINQRTW